MALFKIKKGVKANLPTSYVEGYCYFTTDDGKFYIDTTNDANGRICLNAGMADKLTSNAGSATQPVYFSEGKPVAITGSIANNITGNAATATKLATAKTINGTNFDGSSNITTANWGTARTVTISDNDGTNTQANNNINGSSNFTLKLPATIKASLKGNADTSSYTLKLQTYKSGSTTETYGTSYPIFAQWESGSVVKFVCTNYATKTDVADRLATSRTISLTGSVTGSGTFDGSGNLSIATTTNHTHSEYAAASHTHSYLPLGGGTMTGQIQSSYSTGGMWISGRDRATIRNIVSTAGSSFAPIVSSKTQLGSWDLGPCHPEESFYFSYATDNNYNANVNSTTTTVHIKSNGTIMGAAWNDYAEFRICNEEFIPGQVVFENGDDTLSVSTKRLQKGCSIISDTFGFAIGETDEAKCPIAVSGRVLAYPFEPIEEFRNHIGYPVCSGPNGTVSIMTEEEEEKYPSRIIGTISAIPNYKTWGSGNVEVKNRVWIKVK